MHFLLYIYCIIYNYIVIILLFIVYPFIITCSSRVVLYVLTDYNNNNNNNNNTVFTRTIRASNNSRCSFLARNNLNNSRCAASIIYFLIIRDFNFFYDHSSACVCEVRTWLPTITIDIVPYAITNEFVLKSDVRGFHVYRAA